MNIHVLGIMLNCRCAVLLCTFPSGYSLIMVVVYFPCFNTSAEYECELSECLGFIEACLSMDKYNDIIVLGDMNFDCSPANAGFRIFSDFCSVTGLKHADSVCLSMIDYMFFQETTTNKSVIHHIFVTDKTLKMCQELCYH